MKQLTPQTVYVKRSGNESADAQLFFPPSMDKSILNGMPIPVVKKENQYILSKEDIIELCRTFFINGQEYENNIRQARNADNNGHAFVTINKPHYTDLINNILNNND